MKDSKHKLMIEQLDKKLQVYAPLVNINIPDRGWIHVIRKAYKMSFRQFGERIGITAPSAENIEKREREGSITLKSLEEAGRALDMKLVYGFVPMQSQRSKVYAASNTAFSEVWWFYPSANSFENDRYAVYNYGQNIWYYGSMSRTAWIDRGISSLPIAAGTDKYLYTHESGFDDGSTSPASAISAYIESSQMSIGDGENFVFISKIIPDLTFRNSTANTPSAVITVQARNFPGGAYLQSNSKTVSKEVSNTVEKFTDQLHVRIRGRSFAFKIQSSILGATWRLGSPRVEVRPDGNDNV